jgi:hypothetical protein
MAALKIGVLTFHRCINYGSYWQARCLAEGIQAFSHESNILDHHSARVNIAEWKCGYRPVLPTHVPESDFALYREKMEKFFRVFDTMPLSKSFPLDQPEQMEEYDMVVVGSDEVWNLYHPWYGKHPLFYGEGINAKSLISYAASFGNFPSSVGLSTEWSDKLRKFDHISVRDENSRTIIQQALGFVPEMVLDPCLQFPVIPDSRSLNNLQEPYVAVYGHNFSEYFIREIKNWAKRRNLQLVSIGYRNDWADQQWLTADPHDFAAFMSNAAAVATNFFHGCVFALNNARPFVCETTPYRSNKLQGLMNKIGGEGHLVRENTPFPVYDARLSQPVDQGILEKINHLRQSSNAFLQRALQQKKAQFA